MSEERNSGTPTEAPQEIPNVSRETSEPPKRNKSSSVYVYLAVMFGAAFLMLLLAYFVQQRNNDAAFNNLRFSTNASQEELLADIRELEEENRQLRQDVSELQESFDQSKAQAQTLARRLQEESDKVTGWRNFWSMENAFRDGDYEACAASLQDEFKCRTYAALEETQERTAEIRRELVQLGFLPAEG